MVEAEHIQSGSGIDAKVSGRLADNVQGTAQQDSPRRTFTDARAKTEADFITQSPVATEFRDLTKGLGTARELARQGPSFRPSQLGGVEIEEDNLAQSPRESISETRHFIMNNNVVLHENTRRPTTIRQSRP